MKYLAFILAIGLASCAPLTQQMREESVQQHQASSGASKASVDLVGKVVARPAAQPVSVNVSGKGAVATVNLPPPATQPDTTEYALKAKSGEEGTTSDDWTQTGYVKTGLTVIGYALGIALLLGVGYLVKRAWTAAFPGTAAAVDAEWSKFDAFLGNQIANLTQQGLASTDPATLASINAQIAALEKQRGKAAAE